MQDFEKPGVFYLGKTVGVGDGQTDGKRVLNKSKDLTTHGVIIGTTGSAKTGLGIACW